MRRAIVPAVIRHLIRQQRHWLKPLIIAVLRRGDQLFFDVLPLLQADTDGIVQFVLHGSNGWTNFYSDVAAGGEAYYPALVTTSVRICGPPLAGDTNGDCVVDMMDFANMVANWLECTLVNGDCP